MPEGLHLKNVSVSSSFCGLFGGCWRMPAGVHGPTGSNPVPGLPARVDWEISRQLLSPVRKTCGECRRNYMTLWAPVRLRAAAPELRWSNGRTTMRRFSTDCRRRSGCETRGGAGEFPAGVHGKAAPLNRFRPDCDSRVGNSRQPVVASRWICGECRRNYIFNLEVLGSNPSRALAGAIAQLVEHQTRSRVCFSNPCRRINFCVVLVAVSPRDLV